MHGFTQACAAMAAANLGAHICLERSLARLDIQADDSRAESGRIRSDGLSKGSALLSEVTRTGSLGHEFRRSQYIAPKPKGRAYPGCLPRQRGRIVSRQSSALSGRFRDKWRGYVLNLLAPALRTIWMSGFMFSEMFGMLERLTALLATILVSRHGIPLTRIPHVVLSRYCQQCAAAY
jgi:hypothetical protein